MFCRPLLLCPGKLCISFHGAYFFGHISTVVDPFDEIVPFESIVYLNKYGVWRGRE